MEYGRGTIGLGYAGIKDGPDWTTKRERVSPQVHHTLGWLPVAKAAYRSVDYQPSASEIKWP